MFSQWKAKGFFAKSLVNMLESSKRQTVQGEDIWAFFQEMPVKQ